MVCGRFSAPDVKAIFWDNDGVLVETEHLYFEATRRVLASVGIPLTERDYVEWFLIQGQGAWHLAEAQGIAPCEIEGLKQQRNALYSELLRETPRLVPDVAAVLDALHGNYVMGIVTSSRRDHFEVIHESTGILKYFDFVLTASDYARTKPAPDPYLRAIERSGAAPEECVAIEDSERGLQAATRAGIRCIVVPSGLTRSCRFSGAHRILASAAEIPAALSLNHELR
jgi:HAD superfamily hydrolase (TIGR01509 family)